MLIQGCNNTSTHIYPTSDSITKDQQINSNNEWLVKLSNNTKTGSYINISWYKLEKENHGKPESPTIIINSLATPNSEPQAASYTLSGSTYWYYNCQWAINEATYIKKRLPSNSDWDKIFSSLTGSVEEKAKALNIPFAGNILSIGFKPLLFGESAELWSSTKEDDRKAGSVFLDPDPKIWISTDFERCEYALSLRFLSN